MIDVRNILDFKNFIDDLLLHSECDDVEFKSAAGGFPGSFWDTYSAFANSEGGVIVLGVAEKKILKDMCNAGLLVSKGYGRGTTYHLPDKVASSEDERLQAQGRKVGSSEAERLQAQGRKVGSSGQKGWKLRGRKVGSSKSTRMSYSALSEKICEIVEDEWTTPEELSVKTGKQILYLKNKILPRMLADGLIEMLYPNIPTHPKQQYKTITRTDTTSSQ